MFKHIPARPGDPILSLVEAFKNDPRPNKINLSIGLFYDADGKIPLLNSVRKAEEQLVSQKLPRPYLPIEGHAGFRSTARDYVFGENHEAVKSQRIATVQTIGGSGALSLTASFLRRHFPHAQIWISDPTWSNHRDIFEAAGLKVKEYPYYDSATGTICFDKLLECVQSMPEHSLVLMHPCCHNPTGVDLTQEQWAQLIPIFKERNLFPYLDIAYQGFGTGIQEDAWVVRELAASGATCFIGSSFSKSFGVYAERIGALHLLCENNEEVERLLTQLREGVRQQYSSPPQHGAQLIDAVLNDPELRQEWESEVKQMRERVKEMRATLKETISALVPNKNFDYLITQQGMFSYTGLTTEQVQRLRDEFAIYLVGTGRICVAGLNLHNIKYVAESMAKVMA